MDIHFALHRQHKPRVSTQSIDSPARCTKTKVDMTVKNSGAPIHAETSTRIDPVSSTRAGESSEQHDTEDLVKNASASEAHRLIDQWLFQYASYHENTWNKRIHFICVPLIAFSILGLLWSIPMPRQVAGLGTWLNAATLTILLASAYYTRLSVSLAIGMAIAALVSIFILEYTEQWIGAKVWQASLLLFVAAWSGQFIGHHIEGKRPAFANDLQFLLIGPLWIIADLYRRLGISY